MTSPTATVADLVEEVLGPDLPIGVQAYDGSRLGPTDGTAPATVIVRSADALRRIATAPGELGFARAYVSGDLDVEGDLFAVLKLRDRLPRVQLRPRDLLRVARMLGVDNLRPLPAPPEEARLKGRRHSIERDAAAISHHYDVSNRFYRLLLGPALTYSCAVFTSPDDTLEQAQANKHELICRKLGLTVGARLLDVGCGWGSMVLHAAGHHGAHAVGVTISRPQAELGRERAVEAGLGDRIDLRVQDYRQVADGPYDAISSIGMFEHVGEARLGEYFERLYTLLRPGGRLLNHGICRPPLGGPKRDGHRARLPRRSFINRYVFPDGELHELGRVVSVMQKAGFEVRHVESLREHYARTLHGWLANLEANWDEAVTEAGAARARVWRLYLAGAALNFELHRNQVHQVLAVRPDHGVSSMPLRPTWDPLGAPWPSPTSEPPTATRFGAGEPDR